jgi:hypothetical protein
MLQKHGTPVCGSPQTPALQRSVGKWPVRLTRQRAMDARGGDARPAGGIAYVRQCGAREDYDHESEQNELALLHGLLLVRDGQVPVNWQATAKKGMIALCLPW